MNSLSDAQEGPAVFLDGIRATIEINSLTDLDSLIGALVARTVYQSLSPEFLAP
ncbi:MAG: hypothetical protein INR66_18415 [Gordonia polyisoprenivorans]|nr:hypothetical protein [Gordonia polyisoprenivorans]